MNKKCLKVFNHLTILAIYSILLVGIYMAVLFAHQVILYDDEIVLGALSIKLKNFELTDKLLFYNIPIANINASSRWFISDIYLTGMFEINNRNVFVIYNCQKHFIEHFENIEDYKSSLKTAGLQFHDFEYGESLNSFKHNRKYTTHCNLRERKGESNDITRKNNI